MEEKKRFATNTKTPRSDLLPPLGAGGNVNRTKKRQHLTY